MSNKVPCTKCGAMILPGTAARTGGMCMPCKCGTRESIEASKRYYEEQKKYDPWRELWHSLIDRVHKTDAGFDGLTADEKIYYAVSILVGEVHNGGFHQFFCNSSGALSRDAANGLEVLGAFRSLEILFRAARVAFRGDVPPENWAERWEALAPTDDEPEVIEFDTLDREFWKAPDQVREKLARFATDRGLITPFIR